MPAAPAALLTGMTGGLIALAVTLIVATAAGVVLRRYSGRFRSVRATPLPAMAGAPTAPGPETPTATGHTGTAAESDANAVGLLTEADLGTGLGARATLVQFSTAFCAPCRPTRQILASVAAMVDGVRLVDIDATTRLDLVRRLRILSTPTVFVLGPDGAIGKRASGLPRKADVIAALGAVIGSDLSTTSTGLVDNTGNSTNRSPGVTSRSETE